MQSTQAECQGNGGNHTLCPLSLSVTWVFRTSSFHLLMLTFLDQRFCPSIFVSIMSLSVSEKYKANCYTTLVTLRSIIYRAAV